MVQGSLLPAGRHTKVVAAAIARVVADAETRGIEEADDDAATVRAETGRPNVDAFKEADATNLKVGRDEPAHFGSVRHLLECGQELALLIPVFAGRVRDWRLLDGEPSERRLVLTGKLLVAIPLLSLAVEVVGLDLLDLKQRHRLGRCGHDGVTIFLAPLQHVFRRQTFGECLDLLVSVDCPASLGYLFWRDEIHTEN